MSIIISCLIYVFVPACFFFEVAKNIENPFWRNKSYDGHEQWNNNTCKGRDYLKLLSIYIHTDNIEKLISLVNVEISENYFSMESETEISKLSFRFCEIMLL